MLKPITKYMLIFVLMILKEESFGHDIHMAFFELYSNNGDYYVDIKIDRNDLEEAIKIECGITGNDFDISKQSLLVEQYIYDRFWLVFNNSPTDYRMIDYTYNNDYIMIRGVFNGFDRDDSICNILVFNSCLTDKVENHDNILKLNLNDRMRSFRLNKGRLKTLINY